MAEERHRERARRRAGGDCILQVPRRAGRKRGISGAEELRGKTSGPRAHPFCAAEDRVEQLVTRESPGLAEVGELARQMTGKSPEVSTI